ncbi:proton-coupled thiamine transporter YuaJ [Caldicellulosiruptor kronotskyensis 2002]|uniref:Proton-coupled thiamine transporter YuaJ n=1 Tax=Caldicellulosiruptor kronotskyensis (strain DSM 18902 / VKM B-2412 / 2002) TaxID=632348 RepID=E4SC28_CALK2|nr:energy-coupled thiamine transporter ThiT [Caldicellulosiruptor kronotskyensis]ADQ44953.1 proton-coupled thiamine transporter YuaJ [Caldicellulosiruptor kronotskyensis 2002]
MKYLENIFKDFEKMKWYSFAIIAVLIFISIFVYLAQKRQKFTTKALVYGGVAISLSFILSFIKLYRMPQGGSITPASMLPLFAYAYMFGPFAGIVAGMAYGILQLIQDPYVVHWAQLLLDYPLAFGALGLSGFFKKNLALGILAGGFGRFVFHFISGVVFFASYAPKGTSPVVYSAIYNATYLGPDLAVCLIISFIPGLRSAIDRLKSHA